MRWARRYRKGLQLASLSLLMALNACLPQSPVLLEPPSPAAAPPLPAMNRFQSAHPKATQKSNADLVRDFTQLALEMENGRRLDVFTRFEGPISVRVIGQPPATLQPDLTQLIQRIRTEAQIDIFQVPQEHPAHITIQAISRKKIQRALPNAACFVVPNIAHIDEYRSARLSGKSNWLTLKKREKMAIFLPNDVSPQEIRDCLHEELAQAIGPLNDLYRLHDSVFNDDNVHTVLTGFDMLMLKAYYSPQLHNGMSRDAVKAALPGIFSGINPAGETGIFEKRPRTPQSWAQAIQTALGGGKNHQKRVAAAQTALKIAEKQKWKDHRLGFSHYAMGHVLQERQGDKAYRHFLIADHIYANIKEGDLHRAYLATQRAAYAISSGDGDQALRILEPNLPIAKHAENAVLFSTLLMLKAEALDLQGKHEKARSARLDSLAWARYGFGSDRAVRAKLQEVQALAPPRPATGS